MKEIFIDDIRKIQLEMMDFIDSLCRKKGIRYSLSGGTLLGAVRHSSYIPWDDDIDIFLLRPDYELLIEEVGKSGNVRCKILSPFTDEWYCYPFAKLVDTKTRIEECNDKSMQNMGIYIDIFPIDGLPDNEKKRKTYWNRMRILKRLNTMVYQKKVDGENSIKRMFRRFMFCFFQCMKPNWLSKLLNRLSSRYDVALSEYVAVSLFGYGEREQMSASVVSEYIDIPFENRTYRAIKGYDAYLSSLYGDYMKLPPVELRQAKHGFRAYLEESI